MTNRLLKPLLVLVAGLIFFNSDVDAQTIETPAIPGQTCEYFKFGKDTIQVYALGAVSKNCKWEVEADIGFIDFLTVISPAGLGVAETIDALPVISFQIFRDGPNGLVKVYDASIESIMVSETPMPVLIDGDVVFLKAKALRKRRYLTFRNITTILSTFSAGLLLYLRLRDGALTR